MSRPAGAWALAALMAAAGVGHFVATDRYVQIIPEGIGSPRAWVWGSGVAELACAGLLAVPATRRRGGWCTAALLVVVFPANVTMALRGGLPGESGLLGSELAAWLRLPLQIPLVWWAVRVARRAEPG